jgi:hypothetical protein
MWRTESPIVYKIVYKKKKNGGYFRYYNWLLLHLHGIQINNLSTNTDNKGKLFIVQYLFLVNLYNINDR